MRLWRISSYADLSGEGGRRAAARWNSGERPVVYMSEHPALALLENLTHLEVDPDDLPDTYQLLEIEAPDDIDVEAIDPSGMPADWRTELRATRKAGDDWLKEGRTALLRVPSVILPKSVNVLFNPAHAAAKRVKVIEAIRPAYDRRLFERNPARPSPKPP